MVKKNNNSLQEEANKILNNECSKKSILITKDVQNIIKNTNLDEESMVSATLFFPYVHNHITKGNKDWIDKNGISPSRLFEEAIIDLKEKMLKNIHRDRCVICGEKTNQISIGLGMETFSFCSEKCMNVYMNKHPKGEGLEIKGTRVYVK